MKSIGLIVNEGAKNLPLQGVFISFNIPFDNILLKITNNMKQTLIFPISTPESIPNVLYKAPKNDYERTANCIAFSFFKKDPSVMTNKCSLKKKVDAEWRTIKEKKLTPQQLASIQKAFLRNEETPPILHTTSTSSLNSRLESIQASRPPKRPRCPKQEQLLNEISSKRSKLVSVSDRIQTLSSIHDDPCVNELVVQKEMEKENISKTLSSAVQKLNKLEKNQHYQKTYRLRKKLGLVKSKKVCGRPRVIESMSEFTQNLESMY